MSAAPKDGKPKDGKSKGGKPQESKPKKGLSPKEQKKLQKQAQRLAKKEQQNAGQPAPQANAAHATGSSLNAPSSSPAGSAGTSAPAIAPSPVVNLFAGIEPPKAIVSKQGVHPAVLHLALQMQNCRIIGSTLRCRSMMEAFVQVIRDYQTPANSTLSRSLAVHLSHQIEVLKSGRGLSVSMGNAIRWLKQETSELPLDVSDEDAKKHLINVISVFIRDRLDLADRIIVDNASDHIGPDSDVILTYSHSQVVVNTLLNAHKEQKKKFRVIVVDSPPLFEGKKTAAALAAAGIPTTYILMSALPYVIKGVTTLMVGAHAMVSNGNLHSRVGTSMVAVMAAARSIPVLVLCETIKFSDRVQLDAFAVNEFMPLEGSNSVFFDLTDQKSISKVITEVGALPASSVPVILREYKQLL